MSKTISMYWPISNNFGDLIGKYILEKMTGYKVMYAEPTADYKHYVFGGSVLNHAGPNAVVWGSGLGTITDGVNPHTRINAVRGPISRARALSIGRSCPAVYGDPGMLMPRFYAPSVKKTNAIGVVPHYVDQYRAYDRYKDSHVIDVCAHIEDVIDEICSCEQIISSSLHGIIIAHAYGIPAAWVKISDSMAGDGTKFRDYFASVGLDVEHPFDLREINGLPSLPTYIPKQWDLSTFWAACPIPSEIRKPEYQ